MIIKDRESAKTYGQWILNLREKLKTDGSIIEKDSFYLFTKDVEFSRPSAAAAIIYAGNAAGTTAWKNIEGKTLKEVEEETN